MCFNYTVLYTLYTVIELIYIYIKFFLTFLVYCHKVTFCSHTCDNFNLAVY